MSLPILYYRPPLWETTETDCPSPLASLPRDDIKLVLNSSNFNKNMKKGKKKESLGLSPFPCMTAPCPPITTSQHPGSRGHGPCYRFISHNPPRHCCAHAWPDTCHGRASGRWRKMRSTRHCPRRSHWGQANIWAEIIPLAGEHLSRNELWGSCIGWLGVGHSLAFLPLTRGF